MGCRDAIRGDREMLAALSFAQMPLLNVRACADQCKQEVVDGKLRDADVVVLGERRDWKETLKDLVREHEKYKSNETSSESTESTVASPTPSSPREGATEGFSDAMTALTKGPSNDDFVKSLVRGRGAAVLGARGKISRCSVFLDRNFTTLTVKRGFQRSKIPLECISVCMSYPWGNASHQCVTLKVKDGQDLTFCFTDVWEREAFAHHLSSLADERSSATNSHGSAAPGKERGRPVAWCHEMS